MARKIVQAETLRSKLTLPGANPKYQWREWFSGGIWELVQGEDFTVSVESFKRQLELAKREYAKRGILKYPLSIFKAVDSDGTETGFIIGPRDQLACLRHNRKRLAQPGPKEETKPAKAAPKAKAKPKKTKKAKKKGKAA